MIPSTDEYKTAITAYEREIFLKAVIDIIDPDISYGVVNGSAQSEISNSEQIHNKDFNLFPYITLEHNIWMLDGSSSLLPDDGTTGQVGFVSSIFSDENCEFSHGVWIEETFSNVSVLQACSVYFPDSDIYGCASDFTVEILQGGTAYYMQSFSGNLNTTIALSGFTVYNPDAIRVTITKWSLPYRRVRIPEIIPGMYEIWDANTITDFYAEHQADVSCIALPYGTCQLSMDNLDRRFEPRNKAGIFKSIEERQKIPIFIGVSLADNTVEYKQLVVF